MNKKLHWVTNLINDDLYWDNLFVITQSVFPALRVLRLADRSVAGMHMLYYFTRMSKRALNKEKLRLNRINKIVSDKYDQEDLSDVDSNTSSDSEDENIDNKDVEDEEAIVPPLGDSILEFWRKRSKKLKSDFAIAGWLLCPIKEVHDDMREHCNNSYIERAENVLEKLLYPALKTEVNDRKDKFRQEFRQFKGKIGNFSEENSMWESSLLSEGKVHLWHDTYSTECTQVLGWFACRITSKILGIGSAERAWGAVKQLKQGKRGALSGPRIKKQATIFAKSCIKEVLIKNQFDYENNENFVTLTDEDMAFIKGAGIPTEDAANHKKNLPIFRCWREDWETRLQKFKDGVIQDRFQI